MKAPNSSRKEWRGKRCRFQGSIPRIHLVLDLACRASEKVTYLQFTAESSYIWDDPKWISNKKNITLRSSHENMSSCNLQKVPGTSSPKKHKNPAKAKYKTIITEMAANLWLSKSSSRIPFNIKFRKLIFKVLTWKNTWHLPGKVDQKSKLGIAWNTGNESIVQLIIFA